MNKTLTLTIQRHDVSTILDALQYAALMLSNKQNCGNLAQRATRVQAKLLEQVKTRKP